MFVSEKKRNCMLTFKRLYILLNIALKGIQKLVYCSVSVMFVFIKNRVLFILSHIILFFSSYSVTSSVSHYSHFFLALFIYFLFFALFTILSILFSRLIHLLPLSRIIHTSFSHYSFISSFTRNITAFSSLSPPDPAGQQEPVHAGAE